MKVFFHQNFYSDYSGDPAAESGRMEAVFDEINPHVDIISCIPATEDDLLAAHTQSHIEQIRRVGLFDIAALAAGGAIQAARAGMISPSFAAISPPGHHASESSCWGFCFFNNMAVSLFSLRQQLLIKTAFILDFDYHFGDGNVNIFGDSSWVEILNPESNDRHSYLKEVKSSLDSTQADVIAVSAGFDHHINDWGGLLYTEDYKTMGAWVRQAAIRNGGGCYGLLEGGYNHNVLGKNVLAFIEGIQATT